MFYLEARFWVKINLSLTEHIIWVLESPGLGSRALKGQDVAVVPIRSVESAFRIVYAIFTVRWRADTQHDPSLLRTRGVY